MPKKTFNSKIAGDADDNYNGFGGLEDFAEGFQIHNINDDGAAALLGNHDPDETDETEEERKKRKVPAFGQLREISKKPFNRPPVFNKDPKLVDPVTGEDKRWSEQVVDPEEVKRRFLPVRLRKKRMLEELSKPENQGYMARFHLPSASLAHSNIIGRKIMAARYAIIDEGARNSIHACPSCKGQKNGGHPMAGPGQEEKQIICKKCYNKGHVLENPELTLYNIRGNTKDFNTAIDFHDQHCFTKACHPQCSFKDEIDEDVRIPYQKKHGTRDGLQRNQTHSRSGSNDDIKELLRPMVVSDNYKQPAKAWQILGGREGEPLKKFDHVHFINHDVVNPDGSSPMASMPDNEKDEDENTCPDCGRAKFHPNKLKKPPTDPITKKIMKTTDPRYEDLAYGISDKDPRYKELEKNGELPVPYFVPHQCPGKLTAEEKREFTDRDSEKWRSHFDPTESHDLWQAGVHNRGGRDKQMFAVIKEINKEGTHADIIYYHRPKSITSAEKRERTTGRPDREVKFDSSADAFDIREHEEKPDIAKGKKDFRNFVKESYNSLIPFSGKRSPAQGGQWRSLRNVPIDHLARASALVSPLIATTGVVTQTTRRGDLEGWYPYRKRKLTPGSLNRKVKANFVHRVATGTSEGEWQRGILECDDPLTREHMMQLAKDAHAKLDIGIDHPWSLTPRQRGREEGTGETKPKGFKPKKDKFNSSAFSEPTPHFEVPVGAVPDAIDLVKSHPEDTLNQIAEAMGRNVKEHGHGFSALESSEILQNVRNKNSTHAGLEYMGEPEETEPKDYE